MPNKHYQKGVRAEREVKALLEEDGYFVVRSAGSKSPIDLVAIHLKYDHVLLVQVKTTKGGKAAVERLRKWWTNHKPLPEGKSYQQMLMVKADGEWWPL